MSRKKERFRNDQWLRDHFEEIIEKYGGKVPYLFIAAGKVFPVTLDDDIRQMEKEITKKYGRPIGMPVPRPEAFISAFRRF